MADNGAKPDWRCYAADTYRVEIGGEAVKHNLFKSFFTHGAGRPTAGSGLQESGRVSGGGLW